MQAIKENKEIAISLVLILVPIFVILLTSYIINAYKQEEKLAEVKTVDPNQVIIKDHKVITNIDIKAKAAYVKNLNTGQIIYAKNENQILPLASLTKIASSLVAEKNADQNRLIKIRQKDLDIEGEYFLEKDQIFRLRDLIKMTMVGSVNDTASALSQIFTNDQDFVEDMNRTVQKIGLQTLSFKNETGLDEKNYIANALGSAKDVAGMMEYAFQNYPQIFEDTNKPHTSVKTTGGQNYVIKNTNDIVGDVSGILASKTGYTDSAGGNLALIVDIGLNEPVVIVILGSTDSTTRFDDALKLLENIRN